MGKVKQMVEKRRPRYQNELRESILQCWEEIPIDYIRSFINGLSSRMDKAIKDATDKIIIEEEKGDLETNNLDYDSFDDEYDSEDITDDEYELDDGTELEYFYIKFIFNYKE